MRSAPHFSRCEIGISRSGVTHRSNITPHGHAPVSRHHSAQAPWPRRSGDRGAVVTDEWCPDPRAGSWVLRQPLASIGNRPAEPHKGNIDIDTASVYTAAAIVASIRALSCTTVAFAAVEDDAHFTPVNKLSAQFFVSIQPGTGYDEDEHVSAPRFRALRSPVVVTGHLGCGGAGGFVRRVGVTR
jgi:hypothetical protein